MRIPLSFLTRLPVGTVQADDFLRALGRQAHLFPAVGLVVGGIAAGVDALVGMAFGPGVRSVAAIAAALWVTGALHADGLMDTADGVGSHRSRERMLAIMKDSRVGAMGVVAWTLDVLLRYALLVETDPGLRWQALLIAPVAGRTAMVLTAALWPPARGGPGEGSGYGAGYATYVGVRQVAGALAITLGVSLLAGGPLGAAAAGLALGASQVAAWRLVRTLGGLTGDAYGALNEVAEAVALAVFAAVVPAAWTWP